MIVHAKFHAYDGCRHQCVAVSYWYIQRFYPPIARQASQEIADPSWRKWSSSSDTCSSGTATGCGGRGQRYKHPGSTSVPFCAEGSALAHRSGDAVTPAVTVLSKATTQEMIRPLCPVTTIMKL